MKLIKQVFGDNHFVKIFNAYRFYSATGKTGFLAPSQRGQGCEADRGSVLSFEATPPPTSLRSATSPCGGGKGCCAALSR